MTPASNPSIYSLPVELIAQIMTSATSVSKTTPNALRLRLLTAIRMSLVDSRWREIALNICHNIWTIVFINNRLSSSDIALACYARSQKLPLHICIELNHETIPIERQEIVVPLQDPRVGSRITSVIACGDGMLHSWINSLVLFKSLEFLDLQFSDCDASCLLDLSNATNLRRLNIYHAILAGPIPSLQQLTHFTWSTHCGNSDEFLLESVANLALAAPALRTLILNEMYIESAPPVDLLQLTFPFLNLRHLHIKGSLDDMFWFLLPRLTAPRLETLLVYFPFEYHAQGRVDWLTLEPPKLLPSLVAVAIGHRGIWTNPLQPRNQARFAVWIMRSAPMVKILQVESYAFLAMWRRQRKQRRPDVPDMAGLAELVVGGCPAACPKDARRNVAALFAFVDLRTRLGFPKLKVVSIHRRDIVHLPEDGTQLPAFHALSDQVGRLVVR